MVKTSKGYDIKSCMKGQIIFKEGDQGSVAYLVRSGAVDIYKVMNNKKILLERIQPGEIFGEMSILSALPRSANAIASEYSELIVINKQDLEQSISKSLPIVQALANLLIKRLRRTNEMIREHQVNNVFLSICNVLYLMYVKNQMELKINPNKEANPETGEVDVNGLVYTDLIEKLKEILSLSQFEIDTVFKQLIDLKLIEVSSQKVAPQIFKKVLAINDADTFLDTTKELAKDWHPETGTFVQDLEFIDIDDISKLLHQDSTKIIQRIVNGEIPNNLCFFHKAGIIAWAERSGELL